MSKKKAFFRESKQEPFQGSLCDKCGYVIKEVQDGKCFWNPNPNAYDRNICRNCFEVWQRKRDDGYQRWKDLRAEMESGDATETENGKKCLTDDRPLA